MTDRPFDRFLMPKRAFPVRVVDTGTLVDAVVVELEDRFMFCALYWKPMVVLKNTLSPIRSMDGLSDDFGDGTHAAFGWWLMHKTGKRARSWMSRRSARRWSLEKRTLSKFSSDDG